MAVFLLFPRYKEIKFHQFEIEQKKAEIQYQEEKITHLNDLSQKLGEFQPELQKINLALSHDPSLPSLFNFLQKKASESGLILQDLSPFLITPLIETETTLSGINQIFLEFRVSGSYQSFKNFLSAFEKSARIIEIEKASFSAPTKEKALPVYELKIKTYSY